MIPMTLLEDHFLTFTKDCLLLAKKQLWSGNPKILALGTLKSFEKKIFEFLFVGMEVGVQYYPPLPSQGPAS